MKSTDKKVKKQRSRKARYLDFYNATTYFTSIKAFAEAVGLNIGTCYAYNSQAIPIPEQKIDYIKNQLQKLQII